MEVSYTARDGGGLLKEGAVAAIQDGLNSIRELAGNEAAEATGLVRVFSLKKEFPDVLHKLLVDGAAAANILPEHFPFVIRHARLAMTVVADGGAAANPIDVHVVPKPGIDLDDLDGSLTLNGAPDPAAAVSVNIDTGVGLATLPKAEPGLLGDWEPETWTLAQTGFTTETVDDIILIVKYTVAT
jgi:hypothetical protein